MDKKKVTRRVAIGTAVGGIAAAPFIIRALRGRYQVELPLGENYQSRKDPDYEQDWEHFQRMVEVPIKPIDGPSAVTLDLRPQVGSTSRVISLHGAYWKKFSPAEYPSPPFWYSVSEGRIAVLPPIVDFKPAILISTEKSFIKHHVTDRVDRCTDMPVDDCVLVPTRQGVDYFERDNGTYKRVSAARANAACVDLGKAVVFGYPRGKPLAKGMKWTTPEAPGYHVKLPCEFVGLAQVAGKGTMKIVAEGHLDSQEVRYYFDHRYVTVLVEEGPGEDDKPLDPDAALKEQMKQAFEEQQTKAFQLVSYVDLETGLALRQECRLSDHRPGPARFSQTSVFITQVLDS